MRLFTFILLGLSLISLESFSQNVWILNNGDPDYQNPPFDDSLKLYQSDGTQLMTKSGFNIAQQLSGTRSLAVMKYGEYCWVTENVGDKLSKIDKNGNTIKEISKAIGGIDLISNGNLYALGSNGTIYGDSIFIIDTSGTIIQSAPYGGMDLVVDEKNNSVWIVGSDIKKLNLSLNHEFTLDPIPWTAMSVDFSKDGSIWVGEGEIPSAGQNRILHLSNNGAIIDSISLTSRPNCVRVNRNDGHIWVASNYLFSIDPSNLNLEQIASGGFSLVIDEQEDVWVAGYSDVRKYSKAGNLLLTIDDFAGNDQKYIATIKDYSLSTDENLFSNCHFFKLYPNPTTSNITINNSSFSNLPYTISIFNINGQVLFLSEYFSQECTINVNFLEAGIYIISLKNREGLTSKRFQIIR